MVSFGPLRIGLWDPFQMAFPWLVNGVDPNYLLSGTILQVGTASTPENPFNLEPAKNGKFSNSVHLLFHWVAGYSGEPSQTLNGTDIFSNMNGYSIYGKS